MYFVYFINFSLVLETLVFKQLLNNELFWDGLDTVDYVFTGM